MDFNMAEYKPNVKFLVVIYNLRDQFVWQRWNVT